MDNGAGDGEADVAFFHPEGTHEADGATFEVFEPTALTASVWANTMQHGAPPAAILVRAMERLAGAPASGTRISRVTVDLLGVVPITTSRVRAWVSRPGRAISMLTAEMECAGPDGRFRPVARAHAWVLAASDTADFARDLSPALPDTGGGRAPGFFATLADHGFLAACQWRFVDRDTPGDGPRQCWVRAKVPLVAGEEPTPLVQVFSVIDAANGIAAYLDPDRVTWMNMDMTVHLHRSPELADGWVGVVADQLVGGEGIGTTACRIHDGAGAFALGAQTLLVADR